MESDRILGSEPSFLFSVLGSSTRMSVVSFSVHEWLSHFYTAAVTVAAENDVETSALLGNEAVLTIKDTASRGGGTPRYLHGIIRNVVSAGISENDAGRRDHHRLYQLELVPLLWRLTLRKTCRIFQEKTVQQVIEHLLREGGITSDRYRFALRDGDRTRGFCVQYGESDFEFFSRLLEEEGIFYFFEHSKENHILVMSDYKEVHDGLPGERIIPFNSGGMLSETSYISAFSFSDRVTSGVFTHRNFYFKRPSLDLTSGATGGDTDNFEVYEYPALHTSDRRGSKLAQIRLEALRVQKAQGHGQSTCCNLTPGYTFTLTDHDCESCNIEYLLTNVIHTGSQPQSLEERGSEGFFYDNRFTVIPASTPYRPSPTVDKPTIPGLQTAIVVGPPGQEIHTDEYGRIKVRFHWDREAKGDGQSSCWLRINQPWSGKRWGMIAIPRVGDEVLVAFLDGDPDRPIMVGAVNNADSPALYRLPANQTQVGIRTQSTPNGERDNFHELRFEDKKGSEEIYLQSERDWNILVKNDKGQTVGNDETLLVKNDRKKTVLMNESTSIGVNRSIKVGANQDEQVVGNVSLSVGANKSEMVGANSAETVGLAKEVTVGGLLQVSVGGVMNETVAGAKTEEVGLAKAVLVGADMTENVIGGREVRVGKSLEIVAGDSVVISCGKSTLRLNSDGSVFINGAELDLSASGVIKVAGKDVRLN